jgi:hypothetical protein
MSIPSWYLGDTYLAPWTKVVTAVPTWSGLSIMQATTIPWDSNRGLRPAGTMSMSEVSCSQARRQASHGSHDSSMRGATWQLVSPGGHRGPPDPPAYLKYFLIQDPSAKHNNAIDVNHGVVTAVQELGGLLFTVKDQCDIFLVDTKGESVPPAKKHSQAGKQVSYRSPGASLKSPQDLRKKPCPSWSQWGLCRAKPRNHIFRCKSQ